MTESEKRARGKVLRDDVRTLRTKCKLVLCTLSPCLLLDPLDPENHELIL